MHRDQRFHPKAVPPVAYEGGDNNYMNLPVPSSFPEVLPPTAADGMLPFYDVEFQPSEACPRNFVIFDQTDHRSQIMFNPAFAHKFPAPNPNFNNSSRFMHESFQSKEVLKLEKELSILKEDSDDIDALLSLDDIDDNDDDDGDEVSTARTYGTYGSSSPESCSNYNYNYNYNNSTSYACSSSAQKSSGGGSSSEKKQLKMKRMVKALRGIIPGADQMNTVTVIDEAVKYLKSLKVEAEKLGVGNLEDYN